MANFEDLLGKTISSILGATVGGDRVEIKCEDGSAYLMYHQQDCCESCSINELVGDVSDLIGSPLVFAAESSNSDDPPAECADSWTWTFYRLATIKGTVVLRWLGESNGYYSESVTFEETAKGADQ